MTNSKPKENPHEKVMEQAREKAKDLDILDWIDDLPDVPESRVEIPFPYGSQGPRPYGWGSGKLPDEI